jgi:hypothetical protein
MTTPTNEEVRRQFEAWHEETFGHMHNTELTADRWMAYQAALSSPAVAGLVEAAKNFAPATPLSKREQRLAAALAPFTTGAGHVE